MRGLFEELLVVYLKNKKFVLLLNSAVLVVSIIVLLLLPKWYVGQASMIVTGTNSSGGLSALDNLLPIGLLPGYRPDINRYFVLAHSRRVLDTLIVKFDLNDMYDEPRFREDLYKAVRENINLNENPDGSITIECLYRESPEKAAEMTNFLFSELKRLNLEINQLQAGDYRKFMESVYWETIGDLTELEDSMVVFQKQNGLFDVAEQGQQIINMLSEIQIEKIRLKSEQIYFKKFQSNNSSKLRELQARLNVLDQQIINFKNSSEYTGVSYTDFPDAALTYLRLYRSVKIKEKILEFIVPLVEQAKLEEKKNTVEIYLLDKAVPQLKKVKPKRARILVVIMLTSLLLTYVIIMSKSWLKTFRTRYNELKAQ